MQITIKHILIMKTDHKSTKNKDPKKKLSTLELAMKRPANPALKNLHLLLEPHEIPSHIRK